MKISREPPHNIKPTDVLVLFPKINVKLIEKQGLGEAVALFIIF